MEDILAARRRRTLLQQAPDSAPLQQQQPLLSASTSAAPAEQLQLSDSSWAQQPPQPPGWSPVCTSGELSPGSTAAARPCQPGADEQPANGSTMTHVWNMVDQGLLSFVTAGN